MSAGPAEVVEVGPLGCLPDGQLVTFRDGRTRLILLRRGGTVLAANEACPHESASLAGGDLDGTEVTCPMHRWRFDLSTGRCVAGDRDLVIYPTRLDGDRVVVLLGA